MDNYEESDAFLDGLIEFMASLPQPIVKIINPIRYLTMMESAYNLRSMLADEHEVGEINVQIDEMFLLGAVSVVLDNFSVSNVPKLLKVLEAADCFEVYPLTNGKVQVDLTFQGVLKPLC